MNSALIIILCWLHNGIEFKWLDTGYRDESESIFFYLSKFGHINLNIATYFCDHSRLTEIRAIRKFSVFSNILSTIFNLNYLVLSPF